MVLGVDSADTTVNLVDALAQWVEPRMVAGRWSFESTGHNYERRSA
jgi:hypothetical protein